MGDLQLTFVGHSYGRSLITAAGTDERVAGLVCIAALAPDEGETSQSQQDQFPVTDVFSHIEIADGRVWRRKVDQAVLNEERSRNVLVQQTRRALSDVIEDRDP